MAQCKKTAATRAKKAPADVKDVKPASAEKVKGGMTKQEHTTSYIKVRLR